MFDLRYKGEKMSNRRRCPSEDPDSVPDAGAEVS